MYLDDGRPLQLYFGGLYVVYRYICNFFINSSLRIESLVSITAYGVYLYLFVICSESETFNYLEMVIKEEKPRTPILGCRLGFALQPLSKSVPDQEHFIRKYKRSIINWVSL